LEIPFVMGSERQNATTVSPVFDESNMLVTC
jgi:hypothetical protein